MNLPGETALPKIQTTCSFGLNTEDLIYSVSEAGPLEKTCRSCCRFVGHNFQHGSIVGPKFNVINRLLGRTIAEAVSPGFPPRRPGFVPGSGQVGFVVDKVAWGRFSPSTFVSPASLHSTKFSILTITRGGYYRTEVVDVPNGSSLDSTPHPTM
jgi:hypothetical protein